MKNIVYTSTLPGDIMTWITKESAKLGVNKKDIIVSALESYRDQSMRMQLADTFKKANADKEMKVMAEEGLKDFVEQLKNL